MLARGPLDERIVEVNVSQGGGPAIEIFSGTGSRSMEMNLGNLAQMLRRRKKKKKKVTVTQARELLLAEEMDKLVDMDRVARAGRERVEQMGIIFIDEIDKIASRGEKGGTGRLPRGSAAGHPAHRRGLQGATPATAWWTPATCSSSRRARST